MDTLLIGRVYCFSSVEALKRAVSGRNRRGAARRLRLRRAYIWVASISGKYCCICSERFDIILLRYGCISVCIALRSLPLPRFSVRCTSRCKPNGDPLRRQAIGTTTRPATQPSLTASANAYLGLPFAKSPPHRFSPPQVVSPWSTPLHAQTVKPACIQQFTGSGRSQELTKGFVNNPNGPALKESEDCLYLNIYIPSDAALGSEKAVMFWLHGVRCLLSKHNDNSLILQATCNLALGVINTSTVVILP